MNRRSFFTRALAWGAGLFAAAKAGWTTPVQAKVSVQETDLYRDVLNPAYAKGSSSAGLIQVHDMWLLDGKHFTVIFGPDGSTVIEPLPLWGELPPGRIEFLKR